MGIQGLIYGNCINMAIRALTSLYYAFDLEINEQEKPLNVILSKFIGDLLKVDVKFLINMIKNRRR